MGRVTLTLPRMGETMEEAKVTEWIVAPGTSYARGDVLLEVETDKTVVEVPALSDGTLIRQLVAPGDTVELDAPIAEVEVEGAEAESIAPEAPVAEAPRAPAPPVAPAPPPRPTGARVAASPAARAAARRQGVDLASVAGTGRRGRVTAGDVTGGDAAGGDATVVLLHGLFDDSSGWRGLPRRLAARGLRCVALDLPGHGADTEAAGSFDAAADMLFARLPDGPLHLVGHSLGAALAARLARRIGPRARSLTLFAPAGLGAGISAAFLDAMAQADTPEAFGAALAHLDGGPMSEVALGQLFARHRDGLDRRVRLARAVARDGVQAIDATADIAAAPCPVAVMFGTADRVLDWRDVAHLPAETRLHLVPDAGHLPHLARPDLAAALVAAGFDVAESP